ncbi:ABC transporter permease [Roseospirillum parvum]|uniref:Peptide/nickel transport system permease protein n=1 Tax=Roseospirillum parvum TaxID=83401 RepID=A0A1G7V8M5_9PROT|nr:ABC transporter permease [Roseospirillum parvum]SDG55928.1 peptide/nickel transport system permease protein [Roseospirillum parvum]
MTSPWRRALPGVGRLVQSLAVMVVLSFLLFLLIDLMPGDPLDLMLATNPDASPADIARLKAQVGLDRPLLVRWSEWLVGLMGGELGISRLFAAPVGEVLMAPLGRTLVLMALALGLALAVAVPLAVAAAMAPRRPIDYLANLVAFAGISLPPFWLGLLLILLFAVTLGWLPAGGPAPPGSGIGATLAHLILPAITLAALQVGQYTRHLRAALIEVLRADHIRTARAKGLGRLAVVRRHALRLASLPVVTLLGLDLGLLVSGAVVTEAVFAYPGMGKLTYDAVMGNDYPLALATLMLGTALVLLGNVLADIALGLLDPRIGLEDGR